MTVMNPMVDSVKKIQETIGKYLDKSIDLKVL